MEIGVRGTMHFPRMIKVTQKLEEAPLRDPGEALHACMERAGLEKTLAGVRRVAVAIGSRNIDGEAGLLALLVERLRALGCDPFIVPAMGSHGGATAGGQSAVLDRLGINEETVGAPVEPSMEAVSLGTTPGGAEAFAASSALQADAIVVVNRVAPHTAYSGPVQSGVLKMLAAGLGKRDGARSLHKHGFEAAHLIGEMADLVIAKAPAVLGVALVEDGGKKLSRIEVLRGTEFRQREPELLEVAMSMYPRIPLESVDILIIDEMGKDLSGIGMDPLVTGRGKRPAGDEPVKFSAGRLVVLGLTPGSGGNATGIGHADVTTRRLYDAIDHEATRLNVITSGALYRARIPVVAENDREAVAMALESVRERPSEEVTVVRIRNTRELGEFQVSESLRPVLAGVPGVELAVEDSGMEFDHAGRII